MMQHCVFKVPSRWKLKLLQGCKCWIGTDYVVLGTFCQYLLMNSDDTLLLKYAMLQQLKEIGNIYSVHPLVLWQSVSGNWGFEYQNSSLKLMSSYYLMLHHSVISTHSSLLTEKQHWLDLISPSPTPPPREAAQLHLMWTIITMFSTKEIWTSNVALCSTARLLSGFLGNARSY